VSIIYYLRSHTVTAVLAGLFIICAYFSSTTLSDIAIGQEKLKALKREVRMLRVQQNEVNRTLVAVNKTRTFVNHAKSLELERKLWNTYKVDIHEPTTLQEAEQILDQTANTKAYLFTPQRLHMSLLGMTGEKPPSAQPSRPSTAPEPTEANDILLQLKGAFLVKK